MAVRVTPHACACCMRALVHGTHMAGPSPQVALRLLSLTHVAARWHPCWPPTGDAIVVSGNAAVAIGVGSSKVPELRERVAECEWNGGLQGCARDVNGLRPAIPSGAGN